MLTEIAEQITKPEFKPEFKEELTVTAHYIGNRVWFELDGSSEILKTSIPNLLERFGPLDKIRAEIAKNNGILNLPSPDNGKYMYKVRGVRKIEYYPNLQIHPGNNQGDISDCCNSPYFVD